MKIKYFIVAAAAMLCSTANAQFMQSSTERKTETKSDNSGRRYSRGWNSFYFQYNYTDAGDNTFDNYNGASFEYNRTIGLSPNVPLYIQIGAGWRYSISNVDDYGDMKSNLVTFTLPVSALYHFYIPNSCVGFELYTGINLKAHVYNDLEFDDDYYDTKTITKDLSNPNVGWHVGGNVNFGKFFLGIRYGADFLKMYKHDNYRYFNGDDRAQTFTVGLGFRFGE